MENWLLDETKNVDLTTLEVAIKNIPTMRGSKRTPPALAVRMNDLIIHDTKKWFGTADIRVDTLLIHDKKSESDKFYEANTFRFPGIKDNERLPIFDPGQKIYYGHPSSFLNVAILISRDTSDSDELVSIIDSSMTNQNWQNAAVPILALSVMSPQAAAIKAAADGAKIFLDLAYKALKNITGNTIGVYTTTYLGAKDQFGIGRHPEAGSLRVQDFSFWYEIVLDKKSKNS